MRGDEGPVHVAGGVLGEHCHICAFFNGFDEQHRVLRSFIKEGFEQGDKAFHIVDPELREDHLKRLADAGIDVDEAIATGQLELRRWQDAYLRDDCFDQDGMLALLEEMLGSAATAGAPHVRFCVARGTIPGETSKAGEDSWLEYEARVNYAVSKYNDPVICTYDLTNFSASLVMDMLRVHPVVIVGGVLQENPFFVAPDQFLVELREGEERSEQRTPSALKVMADENLPTASSASGFQSHFRPSRQGGSGSTRHDRRRPGRHSDGVVGF